MLRLGVVEPSQSAWRSLPVLVPKPDSSVRFCIDFQEVNHVAQFDAYLMPRPDLLIDQLCQAQYLSALDLTKGYWQIPVAPEDQEKTTFATRGYFSSAICLSGSMGQQPRSNVWLTLHCLNVGVLHVPILTTLLFAAQTSQQTLSICAPCY